MTFRVEDLTVSLLPNQFDAGECEACTQPTPGATVSDCSCPTEATAEMCDCPGCRESSEEKTATQLSVNHLEALHAQLDELLASVN